MYDFFLVFALKFLFNKNIHYLFLFKQYFFQMIIANECARVLKTQSVFHNMNSPLQNPFAFNIHRNQAAPFPVSSLGSTASSQGSFVNSAISPNVAGSF